MKVSGAATDVGAKRSGVLPSWKAGSSGTACEATGVATVASDRLLSVRSNVGNRQHCSSGVGVNGLGGHQSVNGGPVDAQRGGDGGGTTGSRWLVELPTRDTTCATLFVVSPESRRTIELRSASRPESLSFSSLRRDAAATLHSEPDWPGMDTVGCWRAAKVSKPGKCYLSEELDWSTQALIEAQMEDTYIKDLCGWIQTASEPPAIEDVSSLSGTTRTYLRQWSVLTLREGLLHRRWESADGLQVVWQWIPPVKYRVAIIQLAHGA